ncbi:MAG: hypothetical protein ACTSU5_17810 [Promethearchaeota archaeon]
MRWSKPPEGDNAVSLADIFFKIAEKVVYAFLVGGYQFRKVLELA